MLDGILKCHFSEPLKSPHSSPVISWQSFQFFSPRVPWRHKCTTLCICGFAFEAQGESVSVWSVCWAVLQDFNKARVVLIERLSIEKMVPFQIALWTNLWGHFPDDQYGRVQLTGGGASLGPAIPGAIQNHAEQAVRSKPVSSVPPWLQFRLPGSCSCCPVSLQ